MTKTAPALLLAAICQAAPVAAQRDARVIRGVVTDSSGRAIGFANIQTMGTSRYVADSTGVFGLMVAAAGEVALRVYRLGYEPRLYRIAAGSDTTVHITLTAIPRELEAVQVFADRISKRLTANGFYDRLNNRKKGIGSATFITQDDIAARNPLRITHMLQSIPGVRIVTQRYSGMDGEVRGTNGCDYTIYVDGARTHPRTMALGEQRPDRSLANMMPLTKAQLKQAPRPSQQIDELVTPNAAAAIEVYPRGVGAPAQFAMASSTCGVAVFWTR